MIPDPNGGVPLGQYQWLVLRNTLDAVCRSPSGVAEHGKKVPYPGGKTLVCGYTCPKTPALSLGRNNSKKL